MPETPLHQREVKWMYMLLLADVAATTNDRDQSEHLFAHR